MLIVHPANRASVQYSACVCTQTLPSTNHTAYAVICSNNNNIGDNHLRINVKAEEQAEEQPDLPVPKSASIPRSGHAPGAAAIAMPQVHGKYNNQVPMGLSNRIKRR